MARRIATGYHCVYIGGNSLRYRSCTCTCNTCISSSYHTKCSNTSYAGHWSSDIAIEPHPTYPQLIQMQNSQSSNNDNHNNNSNNSR